VEETPFSGAPGVPVFRVPVVSCFHFFGLFWFFVKDEAVYFPTSNLCSVRAYFFLFSFFVAATGDFSPPLFAIFTRSVFRALGERGDGLLAELPGCLRNPRDFFSSMSWFCGHLFPLSDECADGGSFL